MYRQCILGISMLHLFKTGTVSAASAYANSEISDSLTWHKMVRPTHLSVAVPGFSCGFSFLNETFDNALDGNGPVRERIVRRGHIVTFSVR